MSADKANWEDQGSWYEDVNVGVGDLLSTGKKLLLFAFIIFAAWALFVPLQSAIHASGSIVAIGKNQIIQHRAGGIIRQILANEGDHVDKGDVLYVLEPANNQAELTKLRSEQARLLAIKQRLISEKSSTSTAQPLDPMKTFALRTNGTEAQSTGLANELYEEQRFEFEAGRSALAAQIEGLQQRREALESRRAGLIERLGDLKKQVSILQRQMDSARALVRDGHISQDQAWNVETQLLSTRSNLAQTQAERNSIENDILEATAEIERVRSLDQRQTSETLTSVLADLSRITDEVKAVELALNETQIRAPESGTLIHPSVTTIGGVIKPGDPLAEIVPTNSALEIRVKVQPQDIGRVRVGQEAEVNVTALNPRLYSKITGKVNFVAADTTTDQRTQMKYFDVAVTLDDNLTDDAGNPLLSPGMTGDAFLKGNSRTFASYLLQPLTESFSTAFSEF